VIIEYIQGVKIQFSKKTYQYRLPRPQRFNKVESGIVDEIINEFLTKGIILLERTKHCMGEFLSKIFLRMITHTI
jgi:hypothetical protein